MDMKDILILLIFFLSIIGLIIGFINTDYNINDSQDMEYKKLYENNGDIETITLEKNDDSNKISNLNHVLTLF